MKVKNFLFLFIAIFFYCSDCEKSENFERENVLEVNVAKIKVEKVMEIDDSVDLVHFSNFDHNILTVSSTNDTTY